MSVVLSQGFFAYSWNWTAWLTGEDTIASAVVTVTQTSGVSTTPLEVDGVPIVADGIATAWLRGGAAGAEYVATCHVVTTDGRADDRSFDIRCADR